MKDLTPILHSRSGHHSCACRLSGQYGGHYYNCARPTLPSSATLTFVPPVAQVVRDSSQAVALIVVSPGADFGEAIKLMQQEQDRNQTQGSAGMSPFGPAH